jgi:hypothetical protein
LFYEGVLYSVSSSQIISPEPYHYGITLSAVDVAEQQKNYSCSIPNQSPLKDSESFDFSAKAYTPGNVGCSDNSIRTLYMGIAVDCNFVKSFRTSSLALQRVIQIWNAVDTIFRSELNINLAISEIVLASSTCDSNPSWNTPCASNTSLESRLGIFSDWRVARSGDGLGLWHLVSHFKS